VVAARRAIVLGKGTLAIRIADWFRRSADHDLDWVVPVMPEPAWTESLAAWARVHAVPVIESGHWRDVPGALDRETSVPYDLGISVFYDKILPAEFITCFDRLLNIHNGPLPRYRGVSPINWALKNGESSHGVTIHEITPGIDSGPIVATLEYSIYPEFDEVGDVYARALEYGWVLFRQTMPMLDRIHARPQDEALATYYGRREDRLLGERAGFTRELSLRA
jgi:methionyl-tRNA formyltransferase